MYSPLLYVLVSNFLLSMFYYILLLGVWFVQFNAQHVIGVSCPLLLKLINW